MQRPARRTNPGQSANGRDTRRWAAMKSVETKTVETHEDQVAQLAVAARCPQGTLCERPACGLSEARATMEPRWS
jgi:hypothetical protein